LIIKAASLQLCRDSMKNLILLIPMGLNSVEIIMDIEDRFGIEITDAEAARYACVGDLLGCVMAKLEAGETTKPQPEQWTRSQVLEEIRDTIVEQAGVRRDRITLEASLSGDLRID
jgi:acyl carrier protein